MLSFRHDAEHNEFSAWLATSKVGAVAYRREGALVHLERTQVTGDVAAPAVVAPLARHVLDSCRRQGLSVVPHCEHISRFIETHPEYSDVV